MKTTIKALLVILSFAFFSCQKNDVNAPSSDLNALQLKSATLAVNDVAVESVSEEVNYETYFYGEYEHLLRGLAHMKGNNRDLLSGKGNMHYMKGQAPVVSIDTAATGYPITISIDYGTSTETQHGRVINGKVVIEISGPKNTDGTTRTITYSGCVIDSIGIEGTSTETFNGDNTTSRKSTIKSDVTFTLADGTVIKRVGNNVREWLQGLNTPLDRTDDMIQITGIINVTNSNGDTYTREITNPLIRLGDCHHAVQGTVQYSKNTSIIATLDYGDGVCDNLANLTTGDATVEIVLKDRGMPHAKTDGQHMGQQNDHGKRSGKGMSGGGMSGGGMHKG
ncbi:MAG: hypothetical protein Q8N05_07665 [Bacteroidota bacterium]|nr:hypothetical protein [Bacteroidota bacterium]